MLAITLMLFFPRFSERALTDSKIDGGDGSVRRNFLRGDSEGVYLDKTELP